MAIVRVVVHGSYWGIKGLLVHSSGIGIVLSIFATGACSHNILCNGGRLKQQHYSLH